MVLPNLEKVMPVLQLKFSPDSSTLYFGHYTSCLYTLKINNETGEIETGDSILYEKDSLSTLRGICVSRSGQYVASIGNDSFIFNNDEIKNVSRIPRAATAFTAASFVTNKERV
jgi:WD40 repeat protein